MTYKIYTPKYFNLFNSGDVVELYGFKADGFFHDAPCEIFKLGKSEKFLYLRENSENCTPIFCLFKEDENGFYISWADINCLIHRYDVIIATLRGLNKIDVEHEDDILKNFGKIKVLNSKIGKNL